MRALVVDDAVSLRELTASDAPDEGRIRVLLAGICGTDLEILRGYAGLREAGSLSR